MIFQILLLAILGIAAGTFTGLFPGIHINLVSAILLASLPALPFLQTLPIISLAVFITSMSITHSFLDFIPSIYLGAPDEDNFLAILPGHQLLQRGLGHKAVVLTLYGSLIALLIILIFTPIFIFILPFISNSIKSILPYILIFASFYLILREKEFLISLTIFILAGFLGFASLNLPVKEPLLPLLTGLFGLSTLFISLKSKTSLPEQKIPNLKEISLPKKQLIKSSLAAAISAPLCSFLPGIGSGHAAVIGSEILPQEDNESFLFLVGAINTIVIALSFIALYSINKTRTGSAVAIKEILKTITLNHLIIILVTIFLSGIIAFFLGIFLSKVFAKNISRINYSLLSTIVIFLLLLVNIFLTNPLGLLVLATSTSLGIFTILSGSRRINLLGCLLIPTIIFYLTI